MTEPATVVIADDDPDIRTLIELATQRAGHTVVASVADGEAALSAVTTHLPDLVILDVSMPRLTGLQVCAQLRAQPVTAGVRVLIVSANAHTSAVEAGFAAGANAYIAKPFSLRALRGQIADLVAGAHP